MARNGFRRILVAVRDVSKVSGVMLDKAAALSRASGARVELFHALSEPVALDALRGRASAQSIESGATLAAERAKGRLARVAASRRFAGLKVGCHVEWDFPPHEAVIRRVVAQRCDLLIGEAQPRGLAARLLLANTDWELIRHCPVPVLLIKSRGTYARPAVLAAVDPFHANAKPAALDARIVQAANELSGALRGETHLFHAYVPTAAMIPTAASSALAVEVSPELLQMEEQRIQSAIRAMARANGIPPARTHVIPGDVPSSLQEIIQRTRARIVVMGAVSRSRLRRFFIGNTAERVLDRVSCDVLIVKPRDFRSSVPKRIAKRAGAGRTAA